MTSKVLVKMPGVPFASAGAAVKKASAPSADSQAVSAQAEGLLRAAQLEQNIRFLQEQHALVLGGLHREIEGLRQRNRDLQFQLLFSKGDALDLAAEPPPESPPSEEPTPAAAECRCAGLERELSGARAALQTSQARASALQALLQHHKIPSGAAGEAERLPARLAEAERLVRRLRGEAEAQRREVRAADRGVTNLLFDAAPVAADYLQSIKASLSAGGRGGRFPPLQAAPPHPTPYWQQTRAMGSTKSRPVKTSIGITESSPRVAVTLPSSVLTKSSVFISSGTGRRPHSLLNNKETIPKFKISSKSSTQTVLPQVRNKSLRTTSSKAPLSPKGGDFPGWVRTRRPDNSGHPSHPGHSGPALPDLRPSGHPPSNGSGNHPARKGHYQRHTRPPQPEEEQRKYNTPTEMSEGEHESGVESVRNSSHRNKRSQHKSQDKS